MMREVEAADDAEMAVKAEDEEAIRPKRGRPKGSGKKKG